MRSSSPFVASKNDASVIGRSAAHGSNGATSAATEYVGGAAASSPEANAAAAIAAAADPAKASAPEQRSRKTHGVFSRTTGRISKKSSWTAAQRPEDSKKPPLSRPPRHVPSAGCSKTRPGIDIASDIAIVRSNSLSAVIPAAQLPEQESQWWFSAPGRLPEGGRKAGSAAGVVEPRMEDDGASTPPRDIVVPLSPPARRGSVPPPQAKTAAGRGIRDILYSPIVTARARSGRVGGGILKRSFSAEFSPRALGGGAVASEEDQARGCSASELPRTPSEHDLGGKEEEESEQDLPPDASALLTFTRAAAAAAAAASGGAVTTTATAATVKRRTSSTLGALAFVLKNGSICVRFEKDDTEMVVDHAGVAFDFYYTSNRDAPPSSSPSSGEIPPPSPSDEQVAEQAEALRLLQEKPAAAPPLIPDAAGEVGAFESYDGAISEPGVFWVVTPLSRFPSSSSLNQGKHGSKPDGKPQLVAAAGPERSHETPSQAGAAPPQPSADGTGGPSQVEVVGPAYPQTVEGENGPNGDPRHLRRRAGGLPRHRCRYALDCYPFYLRKKVRILRYYREHLLLKDGADDIGGGGQSGVVTDRCGGAPAAGAEHEPGGGSVGGVAASTGGPPAPIGGGGGGEASGGGGGGGGGASGGSGGGGGDSASKC